MVRSLDCTETLPTASIWLGRREAVGSATAGAGRRRRPDGMIHTFSTSACRLWPCSSSVNDAAPVRTIRSWAPSLVETSFSCQEACVDAFFGRSCRTGRSGPAPGRSPAAGPSVRPRRSSWICSSRAWILLPSWSACHGGIRLARVRLEDGELVRASYRRS